MLKEALSYLIVGGGCSGVAIISTYYANIEDEQERSISIATGINKNKIKKIESYGDIDAYGLQNGCVFRIVDETEKEQKDYSLADFLTSKKAKIPTLEKEVVQVADNGKLLCGSHSSVVTIFYTKKSDLTPPLGNPGNVFKIKRSEIITDSKIPK